MGIPKYRRVKYTDDGCTDYECLSCHKGWEGRSQPDWCGWSYCPHCGVKWEGRLETREQGEPRWKYELERSNPDLASEIEHKARDRRVAKRGWFIQARDVNVKDGVKTFGKWYDIAMFDAYGYHHTTIRHVIVHLLSLRKEEETCEEGVFYPEWAKSAEYRAIIKANEDQIGCGCRIWSHQDYLDKSLPELWKEGTVRYAKKT